MASYFLFPGTMADVGHLFRGKITSVSAKSLPPITPGTKTTKPFDYTAQSLDLALSKYISFFFYLFLELVPTFEPGCELTF